MSDKLGTLGEKLQEAYEAKRRDWAEAIGRPLSKRRKKVKPPPGELPIIDSELG
jgi:hypothetical protein